ncbi:hypothetical protein [Kitasatospora azatica]|uniref:hypothetical protein n=1 Tax=Kitasatospora azatica TaxID=58347 RepID=UPI00056C2E77|nr:hypothetical protein [Kitasatospora azatica]
MAGYTVKPDELDGAGKSGQAVAGAIRGELPGYAQEHFSDPVSADAPGQGMYGWKIGDAANYCSDAWHYHLERLAGQLDSAAGNLVTTGANYRKAEQTGTLELDGAAGGAQ